MHVTLVSAYAYPVALGLRYVSAFLKQRAHGVTVRMLLLNSKGDAPEADLSSDLLDDFVCRCRDADVIGLSLMTNSFYFAAALTRALRRAGVKAPIIWGGAHATCAPRECAEFADYVCIGEGEKAILEFVELLRAGRDPAQTHNMAYLRNGVLRRNAPFPLTDDLDEYPFPDYDLADDWVAHKGRFVPATPELLRGALRRYRACSTRGCPYSCSFCNNTTQRQVYREPGLGKWVRKRSSENIITEIELIRRRYPQIKAVNLIDDLFLIRREDELAHFVDAYLGRVNLPLEIDAFPNTITDRKIELLARLPIALISMGIQSGCQDTLQNMYNRPTAIDTIARAIRILSEHGLHAEYHYLVANPFESESSRVQTLRFVADHHRGPAKIRIFPLQFYPGSLLHDRARREGLIGHRSDEAYRLTYRGKKFIKRLDYLEIWLAAALALRGLGVSSRTVHRIIDFALYPPLRKRLERPWFASAAFIVYRVGRVFHKNLVQGPFHMLTTVLKMRRRRHQHPRGAACVDATSPANAPEAAGGGRGADGDEAAGRAAKDAIQPRSGADVAGGLGVRRRPGRADVRDQAPRVPRGTGEIRRVDPVGSHEITYPPS